MKAKKILLCAVSLVLLLLIVVRIVHVNTNVLTIPEERYAQNQWVELNGAFQEMDDENTEGYSVRILGAEQLTYNEFLEKYGASENPPEGKDDIETVLDVEYEFRNVGNSDGYLLLIQYMIAGPYYSLIFDSTLWSVCTPTGEGQLATALQEDTTYSFHVPYIFAGGFVAQENYDNDLAVVNGHSFKEKKSENTNLAILVSHNFTEPFNQPIAYAQKVGELTNMLGAGHIMVQRYGDILDGKRTWPKELAQSNVKPTLKDAVAGDITAAMPYRAMTNIIEFIKMLDMVVPGFAANETLLYSPELKFYSNKVKMDENLDTNIKGLHCLGDSSGWTRGLMMASVMGVLMGRKLAEKEGC